MSVVLRKQVTCHLIFPTIGHTNKICYPSHDKAQRIHPFHHIRCVCDLYSIIKHIVRLVFALLDCIQESYDMNICCFVIFYDVKLSWLYYVVFPSSMHQHTSTLVQWELFSTVIVYSHSTKQIK